MPQLPHRAGVMALEYLDQRSKINWAINIAIVVLVLGFSIYDLAVSERQETEDASQRRSNIFTLISHLVIAVSFTVMLVWTYQDPLGMQVDYRVVGRPEIPVVSVKFSGAGKWTTFTVLTNSLTCTYFWLATVFDLTELLGRTPHLLANVLVPIWGCIFPLSFLINIVVSCALIPALERTGDPTKLESMMHSRGLFQHNGLVLFTALEFLVCLPVMRLQDFPIVLIYGSLYTVLAWALLLIYKIVHYFFMDPRFAYAPCGLVTLLILLIGLFSILALCTSWGRGNIIPGLCVVLAAALTCKWPAREPYLQALWTWQALQHLAGQRPPPPLLEAVGLSELNDQEAPAGQGVPLSESHGPAAAAAPVAAAAPAAEEGGKKTTEVVANGS